MKQRTAPYIPGTSPARSFKHANVFDIVLLVGFVAFAVWFCVRAMQVSGHTWDWEALWPYLVYKDKAGDLSPGLLLKGLLTCIRLGVWAMLVALITGGIVGALSAHVRGFASLPAQVYVNVLRNTPPLVLLFLVYFFAGSFFTEPILKVEAYVYTLPQGVQTAFAYLFAQPGQVDRMLAAVLTLGLYEGAYIAEIVRAGIESVPKAQWDASASQGMRKFQQLRYVIGPQAWRFMVPPLAGQTISTFKDTALASLISLPELTFQSMEIMAVTRMTFELWILTAAIYLCLSYAIAGFAHWLERRTRWRPLE